MSHIVRIIDSEQHRVSGSGNWISSCLRPTWVCGNTKVALFLPQIWVSKVLELQWKLNRSSAAGRSKAELSLAELHCSTRYRRHLQRWHVLSIYLCDVNHKEEEGKYNKKRWAKEVKECLKALLHLLFWWISPVFWWLIKTVRGLKLYSDTQKQLWPNGRHQKHKP